ncbi:TetR family transcriptional regulator [Sphaerisporangium krabiense]|uniref:AcrR family transcriptional regulator n=1 Tax=Sphaerisporangium krabiense TaxID=763782 RepID=A0A7W8Z4R6_9ACTN|nr:TetR family transcriptional regulator [Sphaerisporangium krabiense]MBB5627362.1 AcrR family transcriptional regulator [Sphaerisporangium krabiense]GII64502.1 TetR family transcriptional regulator [Sphaerisporangium krabiense]
MSSPPRADRPAGLRERKKAKTRQAIQEHALRLFTEQGYDATTVEQIAEAAEVSPSTFFRYFPTKEDVVMRDDYDPMIAAAYLRQPASLGPLAAMRAAMGEVFTEVFEADERTIRRRIELIWSIPALRARQVEGQLATMAALASMLAERTGRSADDLRVRAAAGAVIGAWIAAMERWVVSGRDVSLPALMDEVLAFLEEGMPL